MSYGSSDGHIGLSHEIIDQQKSSSASFVLTLLTTQAAKQFVLHAAPLGSSDGRLTAGDFLAWLGFDQFTQCQHHGNICYYKVIGEIRPGIPTSGDDIQRNEFRRAAAKLWAEKFDAAYDHALQLQIQLIELGLKIPKR